VGRLSSAWVLRSMSVGHERSAALVFLFALFFLSLTPALTHTHTLIHRFCFVDLPSPTYRPKTTSHFLYLRIPTPNYYQLPSHITRYYSGDFIVCSVLN
jgi:hypothetical protein